MVDQAGRALPHPPRAAGGTEPAAFTAERDQVLGAPAVSRGTAATAHRSAWRGARGTALEVDPNGDDPHLGQALDLVVGYREIEDMKLELILGAFFPGNAFARDADTAYFGAFEVKYDF